MSRLSRNASASLVALRGLFCEGMKKTAVNDKAELVDAVQSADALQCLKVSSDMKAISKTTHLLVKIHPKREFSWF